MPLNPRPLHAAAHPDPEARHTPPGFRAWSQAAGAPTPLPRRAKNAQPLLPGVDPAHPLAQVAVVAFIGYTLGRILHRQKRKAPPPPAAWLQARPRPTEPYRVQPIRDRSDIRFR